MNVLTKPAAFWSSLRLPSAALRPALAAIAAVAGYVIFMPAGPHPTSGVSGAGEPQWAGQIEAPSAQSQQRSEPVTSASYTVPDSALASVASKKNSTVGSAITPKAPIKQAVLPPRRTVPNDDQTHLAAAAIVPISAAAPSTGPMPAESIPPETLEPARPRGLLSPVTDHLPARGTLLKPFHVVGDVFHNLIKSF